MLRGLWMFCGLSHYKSDVFTREMRDIEVTCMYCETWLMWLPYDTACAQIQAGFL